MNMTVKQLIERLQKLEAPDLEVTILDGFNAGGNPRTINFGPRIEKDDNPHARRDYSDLDTAAGGTIVVMGYGCY